MLSPSSTTSGEVHGGFRGAIGLLARRSTPNSVSSSPRKPTCCAYAPNVGAIGLGPRRSKPTRAHSVRYTDNLADYHACLDQVGGQSTRQHPLDPSGRPHPRSEQGVHPAKPPGLSTGRPRAASNRALQSRTAPPHPLYTPDLDGPWALFGLGILPRPPARYLQVQE